MSRPLSLATRAARAVRSRLRGDDHDAGFAMIFALLTIFIVAALSLSMAGIVYNQVQPTQNQRKFNATVDAASAGLQVSLNQIRAAYDSTTGLGNITQLKCTGSTAATFSVDSSTAIQGGPTSATVPGATFTGTVNATTGNVTSGGVSAYSTSIAYYNVDPTTHSNDMTWLTNNALPCPLASVPNYAYLQTHGAIAGQANKNFDRTQHATYQFQSTALNVYGGRIKEFVPTGANNNLCMTAPSATPSIGDRLTMQTCQALGTPSQSFIYRKDLSIQFVGDVTPGPTKNLCIAGPTNNAPAVLATCYGDGTEATYAGGAYPGGAAQQQQEWGFNDNGHFGQAQSNGLAGVNGGDFCLGDVTAMSSGGNTVANVGDVISVANCDTNTSGYGSWNPDPQVGAGVATPVPSIGLPVGTTYQFVNYYEFGRCLDITGQNVNADHLIDYPCKQNPDTSQVTFNQKWAYTAVANGYGTMSVNYNGTLYCLLAPATTASSYPLITVTSSNCASGQTSATLWKPTGVITGDYYDSYELINQMTNQCMGASSLPNGALTFNSSNITLGVCNGSLAQKWNAPANPAVAALSSIGEDTGSSNNFNPTTAPTPGP